MKAKKIIDKIYKLGTVDWNRRLFDSLIPLPDGTSYNAYIVEGSEKVALIDTDDADKYVEFMCQLKDFPKIDYVISLHTEQDHSGCIPKVLEKYPQAKVICSQKAKNLIIDHLHVVEEKIITVNDGETLSLGDKTLEFTYTPWVHWPETMCAYLHEDKILFSCDFFGSHIASSDLFIANEAHILEDAKRYFAEIMMPFRTIIKNNLKKLEKFDISFIGPSHGVIYKNPSLIIDAYKEWINEKPKNLVIIPYVSMHHSTKIMVDYLTECLTKNNILVKPFDLTVTDTGNLAMALVDTATIVLGTPTVLTGPHPLVLSAAYLTNALRPKTKFMSIIGSYGWGGRTLDILKDLLKGVKAELLQPLLIKGMPRKEDLDSIKILADSIYQKHKEAELI